MALQDHCQSVLAIEGPLPSAVVSSENESISELQQENYTKLQGQVELSTDQVAELIRQESNTSNVSLGEMDNDSTGRDGDESCSDGGSDVEHRGHRSASVVSDASEEGGRDSGIEAERDPDMVIPDQDLIDRIVTQVEIYFSDASVLKDKFLLKHIRRNKEGYVSLKLVSSFKKIKQLTKDWRVVAYALNKSSAGIQINDLGTKIRRTTPLPEIDDTPVTCTILALNLPLEKPGIDTVSQLFAKCGDIALIRVLKAGATLSPDLKPLASKYQTLNKTHSAWIEFEAPEAVKEACKLSSEEGMKVVPIIPESQKKSEKQTQQKTPSNSRKNSSNSNQNYNGNQQQQRGGPNSRKNSLKHTNNGNKTGHDGGSNGKTHQPQRRKAISLPYNQRPNIRDLNVIVEGRRRPKSKSCVEFPGQGSSAQQSWVQRHLFAAAAASAASAASPTTSANKSGVEGGRTRVSLGTLNLPEGVVRFPKGPDGSKGFGGRKMSTSVHANERTM